MTADRERPDVRTEVDDFRDALADLARYAVRRLQWWHR